jgi:hypothetical protein
MSAINMAALIHPMDQGVLETTKQLYRRTLLRKGMINDFTIFLKKVTMLKAICKVQKQCHILKAITRRKS